jgi:hypothetical protein
VNLINMDQNREDWRAILRTVTNVLVVQIRKVFETSVYTNILETALLDVVT